MNPDDELFFQAYENFETAIKEANHPTDLVEAVRVQLTNMISTGEDETARRFLREVVAPCFFNLAEYHKKRGKHEEAWPHFSAARLFNSLADNI